MKGIYKHKANNLIFKRWTTKNYAVYSSIGKEVLIGHLSVDICNKALLKITNPATKVETSEEFAEINDEDAETDAVFISEQINAQTYTPIQTLEISSRKREQISLLLLPHPFPLNSSLTYQILKIYSSELNLYNIIRSLIVKTLKTKFYAGPINT